MIRATEAPDIVGIAELAHQRRLEYAEAQPQFWNPAPDATRRHAQHLAALVHREDVVAFVDVDDAGRIQGYVFGELVPAPPVYDPGGLTGSIDDFTVADRQLWPTVGVALLQTAAIGLRNAGASQVVVVTGQHDDAKRAALMSAGLSVTSE